MSERRLLLISEQATEILRLRAENEKLRTALKPFAECNPIERDDTWFSHAIRIEDFCAAADALKGEQDD